MSPTWQESWIVRAIENLRKSNGAPEERYLLFHEVQTDLDRIDVEPLADPRSGSGRLPLGLACLAAVAALALLAILVWWMRPSPGTLSGGDLSSVAVLPLTNVSEDLIESDYLAAGITEAVIAKWHTRSFLSCDLEWRRTSEQHDNSL